MDSWWVFVIFIAFSFINDWLDKQKKKKEADKTNIEEYNGYVDDEYDEYDKDGSIDRSASATSFMERLKRGFVEDEKVLTPEDEGEELSYCEDFHEESVYVKEVTVVAREETQAASYSPMVNAVIWAEILSKPKARR